MFSGGCLGMSVPVALRGRPTVLFMDSQMEFESGCLYPAVHPALDWRRSRHSAWYARASGFGQLGSMVSWPLAMSGIAPKPRLQFMQTLALVHFGAPATICCSAQFRHGHSSIDLMLSSMSLMSPSGLATASESSHLLLMWPGRPHFRQKIGMLLRSIGLSSFSNGT